MLRSPHQTLVRRAFLTASLFCLASSSVLAQSPRLFLDPERAENIPVNSVVTLHVKLSGGANGLTGLSYFWPVFTILNKNNLEFVAQSPSGGINGSALYFAPESAFFQTQMFADAVQDTNAATAGVYDSALAKRLVVSYQVTNPENPIAVAPGQDIRLGSIQVRALQPFTETDIVLLTSTTNQNPGVNNVDIAIDSLITSSESPFTPRVGAFGKATVSTVPGPAAWMVLAGGQSALFAAARLRRKKSARS